MQSWQEETEKYKQERQMLATQKLHSSSNESVLLLQTEELPNGQT